MVKLLHFLNELSKVVGNYKISNKKVPKAPRHTISIKEKENFLLSGLQNVIVSEKKNYSLGSILASLIPIGQ